MTPIDPVRADGPIAQVLVVEDYDDLRYLIVELLESEGYRVLSAPDGPQALAAAREGAGAVDVLVTDNFMPAMRGPEVAALLRVENPNLRVLIISGDAAATQSYGSLAGTATLQKPFMAAELLQKVREVLAADQSG
jgi:two-component system cell cycle sensor histidine kinase/response regulator CckA